MRPLLRPEQVIRPIFCTTSRDKPSYPCVRTEPSRPQEDRLSIVGPEAESSPLLTPKQAMAYLGLGRDTVYALCAAGRIPSIRLGKQIRIPRDALLRHLEQEAQRAANAEAV